MSKIEKIQAYIERLMEENNNNANVYDFGCERACKLIKSFIDSLSKEPVSNDLNTAAKGYADNITDKVGYNLQLRRAVCFGANWQKEQLMKDTADAMIGLPYENKDGGYTHIVDVSRPLPVGNNKIAIIVKEK